MFHQFFHQITLITIRSETAIAWSNLFTGTAVGAGCVYLNYYCITSFSSGLPLLALGIYCYFNVICQTFFMAGIKIGSNYSELGENVLENLKKGVGTLPNGMDRKLLKMKITSLQPIAYSAGAGTFKLFTLDKEAKTSLPKVLIDRTFDLIMIYQ